MTFTRKAHLILFTMMMITTISLAQKPHRVGTTAANFLEIGIGSAGNSMGEAYVSMAGDLSCIYWNPAGLAFLEKNEALFMYQPWIADIHTIFVGVGLVRAPYGTFSLGLFNLDYGDIEVTNMMMQEGTGEMYSANDLSFSLAYSRMITDWFAFGAAAKYISSQIWHTSANALAVDLGVIVNTHFFTLTGDRSDGLRIGMSISNYGTRLRFDGMDLLTGIDLLPDEQGNYSDVPGQFKMQEWELPLIFRIGMSVNPLVSRYHRLTLALDALHPNNNSESINAGFQYQFKAPSFGSFYLRGGYKALFMNQSEYGLTLGGGIALRFMRNAGVKMDYAYKTLGILGDTQSYTIGISF